MREGQGYMKGRTMPPVGIVLTHELNEKLSDFAKRKGESRSVVVREALRRFFESEERDAMKEGQIAGSRIDFALVRQLRGLTAETVASRLGITEDELLEFEAGSSEIRQRIREMRKSLPLAYGNQRLDACDRSSWYETFETRRARR